MKILVLGTSRSGLDPRVRRLLRSLASAGNSVVFASTGVIDETLAADVSESLKIDTRWPASGSRVRGLLRRFNPTSLRRSLVKSRMASIVDVVAPDVVYAASQQIAVDLIGHGTPVAVVGPNSVRFDPESARILATEFNGDVVPLWRERPFTTPKPGRSGGGSVVLCYQPTATSPGRYLSAAFERAGVRVEHRYPSIDLSDLPHDALGVVFVESPYPAIGVSGTTSIPVVYWVHHGENHLYQNLRLIETYRADAVLLAHSWHLDHRFAVPTYRFPFGVPIELLSNPIPWDERTIEVAMVGAGFDEDGAGYAVRRDVAAKLTERFGSSHTEFTGGLTPEAVFATYARSKAVVDEGGAHHRPITMRVFEATGSGAALLSDLAPGIEQLFNVGTEVLNFDPSNPAASLTGTSELSEIAAAGYARALGVHTYDHRVDELLGILEQVEKLPSTVREAFSPQVQALDLLPEVDSIACSQEDLEQWVTSSYVAWSHADALSRGVFVDAVTITDAQAPIDDLITIAHRYVLSTNDAASSVRSALSNDGRRFVERVRGDFTLFDFETPGYIVRDRP